MKNLSSRIRCSENKKTAALQYGIARSITNIDQLQSELSKTRSISSDAKHANNGLDEMMHKFEGLDVSSEIKQLQEKIKSIQEKDYSSEIGQLTDKIDREKSNLDMLIKEYNGAPDVEHKWIDSSVRVSAASLHNSHPFESVSDVVDFFTEKLFLKGTKYSFFTKYLSITVSF